MEKIRVENNMLGGGIWFAGWLFTVGYLHLPWLWQGIIAIIAWPYDLGMYLSPFK